jgi:Tol biopolymer transport system component
VQWSADGQALFVAGNSLIHGRGIFRVDTATGDTQLIVEVDQVANPQPTLDGKAIYYLRGFGPLIRHDLATGKEEELFRPESWMRWLDLSPDGKWLAFYHGDTSIVVMPADGGEVREVAQLEESETFIPRFATWTRDGKHLLFSKRYGELWRVNVETGEQQQIGSEIPGLSSATMHSDGKRIAFTTWDPSQELWVMKNFLPSSPEQP